APGAEAVLETAGGHGRGRTIEQRRRALGLARRIGLLLRWYRGRVRPYRARGLGGGGLRLGLRLDGGGVRRRCRGCPLRLPRPGRRGSGLLAAPSEQAAGEAPPR